MTDIISENIPEKPQTGRSVKQWLRTYEGQKFYVSALFLLIPLALLLLFTFVPAGSMIAYSFQERDQFGADPEFVGFQNYITIFTDPDYFITFKNSLYYLAGSVIQQALALLLASILCAEIRAKGFFKGVLFFPYLMNGVAVSIIFLKFFTKGNPPLTQEGTLNSVLMTFGIEPVRWMDAANPVLVNCCLVFVSIWRYIGFDIIMYIGAIQSISPDLYEACDLDGANPWQRFRYIVFPGIKPIISLQLILAVKGAISVFEIPYIITGGNYGTSTFVIKTIETAFKKKQVGLASAMAVVLLIIIVIVTLIQKFMFRDESEVDARETARKKRLKMSGKGDA
ncbi:multiple sugar transport system permease protein [Ruminococcus sp. YE71]|uniref:carbohydrate ABC transporter permease n=1 Tax=unclassified Ruminococcus TaxID=2608920 RepID=UPI00088BF7E3|nr:MULTISPECIES: sugar ABC transporter permease [unclassified Ruminococcus]SDA24752.1 multiple sugar transport system permease protein [Ruminococcus sp. YE78]SFW43577.1 multiple sugar transport system permease protein [Ruminococcus sp. YE71]